MSSNSGFRGFADFASPTFASSSGSTTAAATLAAARAAKQKKKPSLQQQSASNVSSASGAAGSASNGGSRSNSTLRPSPIYTGSDSRLIVLFRKIGQKRDPATKSRALEELISCVFPVENGHKGGVGGSKAEYSATTDASSDAGGGEFSRPEKIAALCHLIFLHETKLGYDNNASVRSGSYKALVAAKSHVPKAWISLFLGDDSSIASDDDQIEFDVDLLCTAASTVGMAWGASKGDPAAEVARNASSFIRELIASEKDASKSRNSANNGEQQPGKAIQMAVFQYSKTILGCKRASSLQEVINPPPVFTSSSSGAGSSTSGNAIGKGKKNKSQGGNKANSNNAEGAAAASESEREEMEERYERVILCALGGLGWMVESRSEKTATDASSSSFTYSNVEPFPESASIVRLMQSSRGSFRREAYTLVGKLCQSAPSLVLPRDSDASPLESQNALPLASLIPNILSSERDPSNFVSLLEMILSYLGAFQGGTNGRWEGLDVSAFTKSLSKALRRACCGAPAAVWGPTILPIVASLPRVDDVVKSGNGDDHKEGKEGKQDHPLPLVVVESLWAGHTSAVGVTDTAAIVSAVTECTTYLMLRRTNDTHPVFSSQSWTKCGQLFLDSLLYFLTETPDAGFGPVAAAVEELCTTLSRDIQKLDAASSEGEINDRGIAELATWFWGEDGMQHTMSHGKNDNLKVRKLGALLNNISSQKRQPEDHKTSHLIPSFKKIFHSIVTDSAGRSNKTCSSDEGGLLLKIINFSGVDKLFPIRREGSTGEESMSASVERFCVNDLLRWILVHASSAPSAAKTDFDIFKKCLQSMPSSIRQKQIWETMLRELIKSYCDFTTLSIGLSTMAEGKCVTRGNADLVRCEVLDSFAIEASNKVMKSFRRSHELLRQHEDDEEGPFIRKGNLSIFLKTCTGISNSSSGILVSMSVIKHWISLCCEYENSGSNLEENLILEDESGSNTLLQTLLVLASPPGASVISDDDSLKLVFQSWFEGGRNWKDHSIKLFDSISNGASLKGRFISNASSALQNDIHCNPPSDHAVLELTCQAWANRASRLLGISQSISLDIVGLNNVELWDSAAQSGGSNHSEFYFLCIMYLLHSVESVKQRNDLIFNNNESQLFVHIQKSICEPESALLKSFSSRTSRNQQLLEILGGRDGLPDGLLERCCLDSVDLLSTIMNDATHEESESLRKALTTLSFLVSILFPTSPQNQNTNESKLEDDDIGPADVKEGDSLWYEKGGRRVKITVMKIHTDDFPNLYFTIKENESNSERQTVASRLKRNPKSIDTFTTSSHDDDDGAMRERVGRHMVDRLLKPYIFEMRFEDDVAIKSEVSAEVINVILSQCGLVSVGIGSVRYEIYQAVSSMQSLFCDALSIPGPSLDKCTNILRCLSLAMGYGIFSISSSRNVSILKIDPSVTFDKLLDLYDDKSWVEAQKQEQLEPFHLFVSMWLAVTVNVVKDGEMFRRISAMITELTDIILSERSIDLAINSFHLLRTISSIQAASNSCMDYSSLDNHDEKNTLVKLTQCFVQLNTSNTSEDIEQWIESFASLVHRNSGKSHKMLLPAAQSHASDLCDCLYSSSKRWCAFQLLHVFAKDVNPLHAEDDATVPKELEQQMSLWKEGMAEEEANELEDDIIITASWLPEKLMTTLHLIEKAAHFAHVEIDRETKAMGNLLAWITCLDILDIAGSVDMRNRSSISSFIQKTKSLEFVMNLALMEADLDINRSDNIFACVDLNGKNDFVLQKVATLVVFRTVESLPTLVKSWFNDDCPRYLQQKLSAFVENRVAPETLQRELVRIKDATSFGEMTVNGSCVSREVVATYQQDECQLSVMIRIPPTFPLRNVEVDCQKTLGIPENRWRRWALQIMLMLNNQDGSVLDALLLWKQNVDKEFDGVEPCPVCYSVLCIKTHAMPNLECKQCHYRFHTSCLYKWFSESGKSSCVLCQQPWSGTKVA